MTLEKYFRLLVKWKKQSLVSIIVIMAFALLYMIFATPKYTSYARLIHNSSEESVSSSGLGLLSQFGVKLGGSGYGIDQLSYPTLINGPEIAKLVINEKYYSSDADTLVDFYHFQEMDYNLFQSVIKRVKRFVKRIFISPKREVHEFKSKFDGTSIRLSRKEFDAYEYLRSLMYFERDLETNIVSVHVVSSNSSFSFQVLENTLHFLQQKLDKLVVGKEKVNFTFIEERLDEEKNKLVGLEDEMVRFLDKNKYIESPRIRFDYDKINRQIEFQKEIIINLQSQLTQSSLIIKKREPVVSILVKPFPAHLKTSPNLTLIFVIGLFISVLVSGILPIFVDRFHVEIKLIYNFIRFRRI
jgi:hypothetical protein